MANILGKLAEVALKRGRAEEALQLARDSRELFGRLFPDGHTELLQGDTLIAFCLVAAGRADEARPLLEDLLPEVVAATSEDSRSAERIREALDSISS